MQAILIGVLKFAPEIAAAIAGLITVLGLQDAFLQLARDFENAREDMKEVALGKMRDLVNNALAQPLGAVVAQNLGFTLQGILDKVASSFQSAMSEFARSFGLPTLNSFAELQQWISDKLLKNRQGLINAEVFDYYWNHFGKERERLQLLALQGLIPTPTPLTAVEYRTGQTVDLFTGHLMEFAVQQAQQAAAAAAAAAVPVVPVPVTPPLPTVIPAPVTPPVPEVTVTPTVVVNPAITVNVPPYPAVQPVINNYMPTPIVNNNIDTGSIASAIPLVGVGIASALAAVAQQMGHSWNQGRASCFGSTGAAMLGQIATAAAPLALTLSLDKFGPFRGALDSLFTRAWDEVLSDPSLQSPVPPERAPEVSRALFMKALEAGMTAHLVSAVAESVAPLKQLGLGYLAAFLTDLAGFSKIGGAMMGTIESQALGLPFKYYINSKVRSVVPDIRTLQGMAAEYNLLTPDRRAQLTRSVDSLSQLDQDTRTEFMKWAPYSGYSDRWNELFYETTHRPASYFTMRAMADAGMYDEPYFISALAHLGYDPETIVNVLEMLRRMSVADTVKTVSTEARYDYIDGFIDQDTYAANLAALGKGKAEVDALVAGSKQRRDRDLAKRKITLMSNMVVKGRLDLEDFRAELESMGVDQEVITLDIADTALKMKAEAEPKAPPREVAALAGEYRRQYLDGYSTLAEYTADLKSIPLKQSEIDDLVTSAESQRRRELANRQVKVWIRDAESGELTREELQQELNMVGLSPVEASLVVSETRFPAPPPAAPRYKTETGKVEVDTARRLRLDGRISAADELTQLLTLEMPEWLAQATVDNDTVRLAAKTKPAEAS